MLQKISLFVSPKPMITFRMNNFLKHNLNRIKHKVWIYYPKKNLL